ESSQFLPLLRAFGYTPERASAARAQSQVIEPFRTARQHRGLSRRRHPHLFNHFGRAPKPVQMRIVGRPQDSVSAEVVREQLEAPLDRLERDETLAAID